MICATTEGLNMRLLTRFFCVLTQLFLLTAVSFCADSPLAGPSGFTFDGHWDCSGSFPGNGKPHHASYENRMVANGTWIEMLYKDIEPAGYDADFLIGYDTTKKEFVTFVGDNKGYAMLSGPGWQGRSLTLTMTGQASYPGFTSTTLPTSRVTLESKSADTFTVTWEEKEGTKWNADDLLTCKRTKM